MRYRLENFAFITLPQTETSEIYQQEDIDYDGLLTMSPKVLQHLATIFAHTPSSTTRVALALPLSLINIKTLTLAQNLEPAEVIAAMQLQISEAHLPPSSDTHTINIQRLKRDFAANEDTWLIAAAPKTIVHAYSELFRHTSLPLKTTVLDIDLYACARAAILLCPQLPASFIIANIDTTKIQLGLVIDSNLVKTQENTFAFPNTISALSQFIQEKIQELLQTTSHLPTNLILCGENATTELKQNLSAFINIETTLANPFEHVELAPKLKLREHHGVVDVDNYNLPSNLALIAPQMMLCCGLSLHGIKT